MNVNQFLGYAKILLVSAEYIPHKSLRGGGANKYISSDKNLLLYATASHGSKFLDDG